MSNLMTLEDVKEVLRKFIKQEGTQEAAAAKIGISAPYLVDLLRGRREPGPKVLEYFDIELVKGYRIKK